MEIKSDSPTVTRSPTRGTWGGRRAGAGRKPRGSVRPATTPLPAGDRDSILVQLTLLQVSVFVLQASVDRLLEQGGVASKLSREDRHVLARLLPPIGATIGSDGFLVRELLEHPAPALRIALEGMTAKRLGRLFVRGDGHPVAGFVVERLTTEHGAAVWRVRGVVL